MFVLLKTAKDEHPGLKIGSVLLKFFLRYVLLLLLFRYLILYGAIALNYQGGLLAFFKLLGTDFVTAFSVMQNLMADAWVGLLFQLAAGLMIPIVILYLRKAEKRSYDTIGYPKKDLVPNYLAGYVSGACFICVQVAICVVFKALVFNPGHKPNWLMIPLFFIAFMAQGMSEETGFRGWLFVSLAKRLSIKTAILLSAVLFSLFHIVSGNFSLLAFLNIFLWGIFACLLFMLSENLWLIGGLHAAWNFFESSVFGISVSGAAVTDSSIFSLTPSATGTLLNGGSYGIEAGLPLTLLLLFAIAFLLSLKPLRQKLNIDA